MNAQVWMGVLLPLLGTSLGTAMVFVLKDRISDGVQQMLTGFAAGVMLYIFEACCLIMNTCRKNVQD